MKTLLLASLLSGGVSAAVVDINGIAIVAAAAAMSLSRSLEEYRLDELSNAATESFGGGAL